MRYSQPAALVISALCAAAPHVAGQEPLSEEGFGFFYDSLVPYGDWVQVADYGPCWRPATEEDWAPYTDGYWAYTDVGWTWVSHEPFGSIVYHYGRWLLSDRGWCWVPGADWSPAWVSWRAGQDYIGWAPLPPQVPWHPQRGISTWVDVHTEIGPAYYRFCSVRDFTAPILSGVLLRPSRNAFIMVRTENVTQIIVRNSNVYCGGPGYDWVSGRAAGRIPLLRVAREENVTRFRNLQGGGGLQNIVHNNILVLPAPKRVEFAAGFQNLPAPAATLSFSKGWYSNPVENEKLRSHLNREWEQRRATPPPPSTVVRDPSGATVRLTAPTVEEKKAVFTEIASNPPPAPSNREKDARGGKGFPAGADRTSDVPKALPVQTPSTPASQKPVGSNAGTASFGVAAPAAGTGPEGGVNRLFPKAPPQTGNPKPEESPVGSRGTSPSAPPATGTKTFPRAVSVESRQRNPFASGEAVQPSPGGQTPRGFPPQPERDSPSNTSSKPVSARESVTPEGALGGAAPVRSSSNSNPGFGQPSPARSSAGFSQQPQFPTGSGFSSRPSAPQGMSSGGGLRSSGTIPPVQTLPTYRPGQSVPGTEAAGRSQGAGGGQPSRTASPSPVPAGVSGAGGGGAPGTGRPQSVSSGPGVAPAASPASTTPAAAGQKKKPGDPGYVPGSP